MKFVGTLDGNERSLSVQKNENGTYAVCLGEERYEVDACSMRSGIVTAIINDKSYDIDLESAATEESALSGAYNVRVRGRVLHLEMLDIRRKKMKEASLFSKSGSSNSEVKSPMPGKIVKILVKEGDKVKEGQGVAIVEAMKMENELSAPKDGVVAKIYGTAGKSVVNGETILTID